MKCKSGQSLVEALLAFSIYVVLLSSLSFSYMCMQSAFHQSQQRTILKLQEKEEKFQRCLLPITNVNQVLP